MRSPGGCSAWLAEVVPTLIEQVASGSQGSGGAVRHPNQDASTTLLTSVVDTAQTNATGQARIALGATLMNEPTWFSGPTPPATTDYPAQEAQQEQELTAFVLNFIMTGRYQIELAAGGNSANTIGVDYRALLNSSSQAREVTALYRQAGLDLNTDLARLTTGGLGRG